MPHESEQHLSCSGNPVISAHRDVLPVSALAPGGPKPAATGELSAALQNAEERAVELQEEAAELAMVSAGSAPSISHPGPVELKISTAPPSADDTAEIDRIEPSLFES